MPYHPYHWKRNRSGYVNCFSQDYIIPQLRQLRQTAWQAENELIMIETREKRRQRTAAATTARISKAQNKKGTAAAKRNPPTSTRDPPTRVVRFEDEVEIQARDNDIQELRATIAQYEQEKLRLKKKDKKIEQMKLRHQGRHEEAARVATPTTSEIGSDVDARLDWEENDAIADYKLAVHWKLFANGSLVKEDDLNTTGKRRSTDLATLELVVNEAVDQHIGSVEIDHEVASCYYIVRTASHRGHPQKGVITDFSTEQTDKIFRSCDLLSCSMPTQAIVITFEFKLEYDKQEFKAKKKQATVIAELNPAMSEQVTALNSRLRAPRLLEQANTRLGNIEKAGDFQRTIMQRWRCHNSECRNQNNLCYVDPWDGKHYAIAKIQHEAWANAIAAGDAVVDQPPDRMYNYLKFEQGAVGQEYRKPGLKKNKESGSLDSTMAEMLSFQQEQMKMSMQQQMFDSMDRFQRAQELREQRSQQQQVFLEQQHAGSHSHSVSRSAVSQPVVSRSAVSQPAVSQSAAPSSSPITDDANEDNVIKEFFEWLIMKAQRQDKRDRLEFAMIKTLEQDWSINDLKAMKDPHSPLYDLAVNKLQISDGIARSFKRELESYKHFHSQAKAAKAAGVLADLRSLDQEDEF